MPDSKICLEALSVLSGCNVESTSGPSQISPQDLVNIVALREFYRQEGLQELEYPSIGTMSLQDDPIEPDLYGPAPSITAGPANLNPPAQPDRNRVRLNLDDFFDPQYNYDFTHIQDGDRQFLRGNEKYVRPCGWNRVALRVTQRYEGGDVWLGTGKDAWPVSYHGHSMDGSLGVILVRGGEAGDEPAYLEAAAARVAEEKTQGRGVYSTPDLKVAEKYCKTFRSEVDGKKYKVLLQNRINPKSRFKCQREDVWLVYIPEALNQIQTRTRVEESIRPYGLLLKEV
ncbi:unnamed protein product [Ophioblennius macclurei]